MECASCRVYYFGIHKTHLWYTVTSVYSVRLVKGQTTSFLTWFGHDFPAGQFVSVRSFLMAATT